MALERVFKETSVSQLPSLVNMLFNEHWRYVQTLCVNTENGIDVIYSFMKDNVLDNYKICGLQKGDEVPSVTDKYLEAFVFENEAHDLFGIKFTNLALDFGGHFYALSCKEPMTIISPEQKAAREKAAKLAAAKAAKAAKEAGEKADQPDGEKDIELEIRLAAMDPEKAAKVRAAMEAKKKAAAAKAAEAEKDGE